MKYKIRNIHDAEEYEVEEIDAAPVEEEKPTEEVKDEETLTPEEIASLKQLAAHAPELIKLLEVEAKEHEAVAEDEAGEEEVHDGEELPENEEVIDTAEENKQHGCDSVNSFGSVETNDSNAVSTSIELEVEDAWNKRFNGGK